MRGAPWNDSSKGNLDLLLFQLIIYNLQNTSLIYSTKLFANKISLNLMPQKISLLVYCFWRKKFHKKKRTSVEREFLGRLLRTTLLGFFKYPLSNFHSYFLESLWNNESLKNKINVKLTDTNESKAILMEICTINPPLFFFNQHIQPKSQASFKNMLVGEILKYCWKCMNFKRNSSQNVD